MFGPTTGDKVRLGDTSLWIEVEHDHTTYGEELKFGGGKVIREGMVRHPYVNSSSKVTSVLDATRLIPPLIGSSNWKT